MLPFLWLRCMCVLLSGVVGYSSKAATQAPCTKQLHTKHDPGFSPWALSWCVVTTQWDCVVGSHVQGLTELEMRGMQLIKCQLARRLLTRQQAAHHYMNRIMLRFCSRHRLWCHKKATRSTNWFLKPTPRLASNASPLRTSAASSG